MNPTPATDERPLAPPQARRILIAEDNAQVREQIRKALEAEGGLVVDTASDGKEALAAVTAEGRNYSIFLTDLKMPGMDGMELIEAIRKQGLPVTVIVMTGHASIDHAVQAMRLGAYDFLPKPIDRDYLLIVVRRALRDRSLQDEVMLLREQMRDRYQFHNIISKSPRMEAIFELISNVAHTTTTVLLEGATGTGKEMVALAIHQASAHVRPGKFVAINCAALPETLLESELFGHEKGAFTGAIGQRQGRFELADGGTLFLDEIGEIPPTIQAKLLRVLQERRFERVGGTKSIEVDLRLIAATNRPLARMVKQGKFREDLYFRVNVVRIELPPLRQRPEDIPLLAAHFAAKYARPGEQPKVFSPQAMEVFLNYHWPGNVRELVNVVERACVIARGESIEPVHLPPELSQPPRVRVPYKVDLNRPLPEVVRTVTASVEKQYIEKALEKTGGNVSRSAEICGLSRRSLTTKIAEYRIDKKALSAKGGGDE
ncbi:MAG: sigma-54 dependent transcriptional regulator [Gemmataceae bacterium]|nr:sigma-54 dependent transcriptional regulator [Gemmataceae bacterium]